MAILVTGASGQLGYDVVKYFESNGFDVYSPTHSELDITVKDEVTSFFQGKIIDAVIHCAAYTKVDFAEEEKNHCMLVNVCGTLNLVEQCRILGIPILYVSTDYVFSGQGDDEWEVDDPVDPVNIYGLSKLLGEEVVRSYREHYILRISWVFGLNGNNFVKTILKLSKTRDVINVVDDQVGSPTYTHDLAPLINEMIFSEKFGTYHAHNSGVCSWCDFAKEICRMSGASVIVNPVKTEDYKTKAKRPANSRLSTKKTEEIYNYKMPPWKDALGRYLDELSF